MKSQPLPPQHFKPQTLRERLCHLFHRSPATRAPHWDIIKPEDLPVFDIEAEWAALAPRITRLTLDEAHGDVADRLIQPRVDAYGHELDRLLLEQEEALQVYRLQGVEHLARLTERVRKLREDRANHAERVAYAWEQLCGTPPAPAQEAKRIVPIPVTPPVPVPVPLSESTPDPNTTPDGPADDDSDAALTPAPLLRPVRDREEA